MIRSFGLRNLLFVAFVWQDGTRIFDRRVAMRQVLHQRQLLAVLQTLLKQFGNGIVALIQKRPS
jgi:hypothetical protein